MILGFATYRERGVGFLGEVGPMVGSREAAEREAERRNEYAQGRRLGTWEVVAIVRLGGAAATRRTRRRRGRRT